MKLIGDGAAVASCPMRRGGGFLPDAARLPDEARRWLLARCCAAVASCQWLRGHLSSSILRTDIEGWRVSKVRNVEQDVANRGRM